MPDRPLTWVLLLVAGLAAWIDCGRLHDAQNADSLLPVLVSIQHWTVFFWGQDRFGMLVPLLALPFHNPFVNLLVQGWLTIAAALLAPFLVSLYFDGDGPWVANGALADACLLFVVSAGLRFDWLITQPYAVSISLALGGLLLLERSRGHRGAIGLAVVLMLLAHWVNLTVSLVIVPLVVVRARSTLAHLSTVAVGAAGGALIKTLSAAPSTTTGILPIGEWPHGWLQLARTASADIAHPAVLAAIVALALFGAVSVAAWSRSDAALKVAAMALLAGLAYWLIVGTLEHVQRNDYYARYVLPSLLLFGVAATRLVIFSDRRARLTAFLASATLAGGAIGAYGAPSLHQVRKNMDRTIGVRTPAIVDLGATVVAGDYWTVWPAVFHANVVRYEKTGRSGIYGLTYRSDATNPLWMRRAETDPAVLVAPRFDKEAPGLIARAGLPITFTMNHGTLVVYRAGGNKKE
jgi:hypothetical protein